MTPAEQAGQIPGLPDDGCPGAHAALVESACLVEPGAKASVANRPSATRACRGTLGPALFLGATLLFAVTACLRDASGAPRGTVEGTDVSDGRCLMELSAQYPEDLLDLGEPGPGRGGLGDWLAAASATSEAAAEAEAAPLDSHVSRRAQEAIAQMLDIKDPQQAKALVQRTMARAVEESKVKRRSLKNRLQGHGQAKEKQREQHRATECAFDVMGMLTSMAAIGAFVNDAMQTCAHVSKADAASIDRKTLTIHRRVCTINIVQLIVQVVSMASMLAESVGSCAATISTDTKLDTSCAQSVIGIITSAAGASLSGVMIHSACNWPREALGYVPSDIGNNKYVRPNVSEETADLQPPSRGGSAPRRLMYGGGKASLMVNCVTAAAEAVWSLAAAALAIDSAARKEGGTCPPKDLFTKKEEPNQRMSYKVPQAKCAADVGSIITSFFLTATFIQKTLVTCTDRLDLDVVCGQAITTTVSVMSLLVSSGSGLFLSCDQSTRKYITRLGNVASQGLPVLGEAARRRLAEGLGGEAAAEAAVAELKASFSSPEEAFKSVGFDLSDPTALYHKYAEVAGAAAERSSTRRLATVLAAEASPTHGGSADVPTACGGSADTT